MSVKSIDIQLLSSTHIDDILTLQEKAIANGDPFTPSSRELYERAFLFQNFVFGVFENNKLIGYCNCSIPTHKASMNLGKGIIPVSDLDTVGHINTILIDAQFRRNSYGGLLLSAVLNHFKKKNLIKYVFTTIQTINLPSYRLFLKYGFKTIRSINNKGKEKYLLQFAII